jgi:hypothetical protein
MALVSSFLGVDVIPLPPNTASRYPVVPGSATGNAKQRWLQRIAARKLAKKQAFQQYLLRKQERYRRYRFRHFDAAIRAQLREEEEEIKENHLVPFTAKELSAAWRERAASVHQRKRARETLRELHYARRFARFERESDEERDPVDFPSFRGSTRRQHFHAGRLFRHWSQNRKWKKHMARQARASRKSERHE